MRSARMQKLARTFAIRIKNQRTQVQGLSELTRSADALLLEHPALQLSAQQMDELMALIRIEWESLSNIQPDRSDEMSFAGRL
jgi:hypothetical protein